MGNLASLGLVVAALLSVQDGPRPVLERSGVLELTLPQSGEVRLEWFRLDAGLPGETPLGLVRLARASCANGDLRLESETLFFDVGARVLHVERLEDETMAVVWREIGPEHGRTVRVEWDRRTESLDFSDTSRGQLHRRRIDAGGGVLTPLYLLEHLRAGRLSEGSFPRLAVDTGAVETLRHELGPAPAPLLQHGRLSTWRRSDGCLAGRYAVVGERLVAFQVQEGGPIARVITEAEYRRLRQLNWHGPGNR